jgi:uncharacterized protein with FMN-binding domain
MKKILMIIGSILLIILLAAVVFKIRFNQMVTYLSSYTLTEVDLTTVPDGSYKGHCGKFLVSVDLEVDVKDHAIKDIRVSKQKCGKGYDGKAVIERVQKAQKLEVDVKTGATGSSKCILIALEQALLSAGKK